MRVIAGSAKGQKLETLQGLKTRPTGSKVKEGVFSAIQFDIPGCIVLDLFAGSGQMGIEALSRGAKSAIFIDTNIEAVKIIKKNLNKAKLMEKSKIASMDAFQYVLSTKDIIDIAFLDPPFDKSDDLNMILSKLSEKMSDKAIIICETPKETKLDDNIGNNLKIYKTYKYGIIKVTTYRKEAISG